MCNVCEKKQKQLPNVSACNTLLMTSHIIAREIGKCRPPCLYSEIAISNPTLLLHFVAFFHVASLLSTGVDNKKVGIDKEKALELTNSTVFHRDRQ